jgi:hypothetical protein
MSEPEANTCTKLSSHGYKGMLPTQTTTKGFQSSTRFQRVKGVVGLWIWWNLGQPLAQGARYAETRNEYAYNHGVRFKRSGIKIHNSEPMHPEITKFLVATQWGYDTPFLYSKVGLDWIVTWSKNFFCRRVLLWKTAEQRCTKLSITFYRKSLKSWKIHSGCSTW